MDKSKIPESNRWIRCKGFDWSPFECIGMFKDYSPRSPQWKRGTKSRYFGMDKFGNLFPDAKTWLDVDTWEYADELKSPASGAEKEKGRG